MGTLVKLTDASVADIDRNGNQSMPFRFFFFCSRSLLYFFVSLSRHEKEIKNKLSTDSPCIWATQCWVITKESIRELVKIVHIAEDDHENFGEARVAGRASL